MLAPEHSEVFNMTPCTTPIFRSASILAAIATVAASAHASAMTGRVDVFGTAPLSCSVSTARTVVELAPQTYQLAVISRDCNGAHQLALALPGSSAQIDILGTTGAGSLTLSSGPVRQADAVVLSGVTRAEADTASAALQVSVAGQVL